MALPGLADGLGQEEAITGSVAGLQAQHIYVAGSLTLEQQGSGLNIYATGSTSAGRVLENSRRVLSIGAGSPTSWGQLVLAGSGATGAGSTSWVLYNTTFGAAPMAVVAVGKTLADANTEITVGSIAAGSFYAVSHGAASTEFRWVAVGAP